VISVVIIVSILILTSPYYIGSFIQNQGVHTQRNRRFAHNEVITNETLRELIKTTPAYTKSEAETILDNLYTMLHEISSRYDDWPCYSIFRPSYKCEEIFEHLQEYKELKKNATESA
jgi:hypothetical protein